MKEREEEALLDAQQIVEMEDIEDIEDEEEDDDDLR
jgi:hypothetical protein